VESRFVIPSIGRPFRAVIFDMDGLMLDTEPEARNSWERAMGEWGRVIPEPVYLSVVGRSRRAVQEIFVKALGPDLPIEAISERVQVLLEEAFSRDGVPVKPGLIELLSALERVRIPAAVASSTHRRFVAARLAQAGLGAGFDVIVGGDEVVRSKPFPDLFLEACRRLRLPPGECVVLEDSEPGIKAAHAAGMIPLLVPDTAPPSAEAKKLALGVFSSLAEVKIFLGL
jgi:HAD superfamily hydrolase (TIGR01509 family)